MKNLDPRFVVLLLLASPALIIAMAALLAPWLVLVGSRLVVTNEFDLGLGLFKTGVKMDYPNRLEAWITGVVMIVFCGITTYLIWGWLWGFFFAVK